MHSRSASLLLTIALLVSATTPLSVRGEEGECSSRGLYEGEFFPGVGKIEYEGAESTNPLSFHYYNADEVIMGKPMKEWLRFSVAFWHTMRGDGSDPFGSGTKLWPWEDAGLDEMELAYRRMRAMFEFLDKLGVDYWCFHDRDIAPELGSLAESNAALEKVVELAEHLQKETGKKVLWGTAQLFKHPRFAHGAATSPNASVHAYSAAQVKAAMDATLRLGGENYVFWGGREGYHTLLNTDLKLELDNLASFLKGAVAYKNKIGFKGELLLEPKPQEPTKHQYDWDVATTMGFLHQYGLSDEFKLNVECNHATLAGHSCDHELRLASAYGKLGNIDANTGDAQTGWDTDQFLTDPKETLLVAATILKQGGLAPGGINFDAKLRRESTSLIDLFYGHISGMDAMARGLRNAAKMLEDGVLPGMVKNRYSTYSTGVGKKIRDGKVDFVELEKVALSSPDPIEDLPSGSAELYEIILGSYIR
ncbi:g3856 [Coccomyxa viridis]|uniref:Xylose isomerase n=1 Tax=Coccomyxa viridis TaxID=1274662 RepID=A0ABP1FU54_9CHLO